MKIFAIADLHLSFDPAVDKPMDIYGELWSDHAQRIRENWIRLVGEGDIVVIPGDVSWALKLQEAAADLRWIDSLPGRKLIFKGNHDLWWSSMAKMGGLYQSITFMLNSAYEDEKVAIFGSRGWLCPGDKQFCESSDRKVYERELIRLGLSGKCIKDAAAAGKLVIGAMHFPPTNENKQESGFTDLFSKFGAKYVVYGHLHGEQAFYNGPYGNIGGAYYTLCSADKLGCVPKLIAEV